MKSLLCTLRFYCLQRMAIVAVWAVFATTAANAALVPDSEDQGSLISDYSELPQVRWVIETVQRNDSLSKVFKRAGFNPKTAIRIWRMPEAKLLHVIRPGDEIRFGHDPRGELLGVEFRRSESKRIGFLFLDGSIEIVPRSQLETEGSLAAMLESPYMQEEATRFPMPEVEESGLTWTSFDVKRKDTLTRVFKRAGLPVSQAIEIANSRAGSWLNKIRPGQEIRIAISPEGEFSVLEMHTSPLTIAMLLVGDGYYYHTEKVITPDMQQHQGCGIIKSSLFASGKQKGFGMKALYAYVGVFESRIDFARELQPGDEFCMIYEQGYLNQGTPVGDPVVIAASFRQKNRIVNAIRFEEPGKAVSFYDQFGDNLRGHFLRSPLKYGRVTSSFSKRRFHPVLKKWRPHRGVDYGAPSGTPVMSTANGVILKRQYLNQYGNVVFIRHGSKYVTVYAHLKAFAKGLRVGSVVEQGQIIGYVGRTGLATGSHLHYEFRVNDVHRDPLRYPLPKGDSVDEKHKEQFLAKVESWSAQLESIDKDKPMVAYTPPTSVDESATFVEAQQQ